jgi:hypothetical protein
MFIIVWLHCIVIAFRETMEMVEQETWENKCCRCEGDVKVDLYPGKRACHMTCGPCMYPDDWGKCASCEIVGHCAYALEHLKSLKPNGLKKGCYFEGQLTGEENLYQTMNFVNGQQQFARTVGEKEYLENLKKANAQSPCLQK